MSEGDSEAGDVPDVHRGLEEGLDGRERSLTLRVVTLAGAGLELAGAQLVEVAVGGHVGAGGRDGGRHQDHQHRPRPVRDSHHH